MVGGKEEQERRRGNRERKERREVLFEMEITWKQFFLRFWLIGFYTLHMERKWPRLIGLVAPTRFVHPWHPDVKTGLVVGTSIPRNKSGFRFFSPFEQLMYLAGNRFHLQLAFCFYIFLVLWYCSEKGPAVHGSPDASSFSTAFSQPSDAHSIVRTYVLHPTVAIAPSLHPEKAEGKNNPSGQLFAIERIAVNLLTANSEAF